MWHWTELGPAAVHTSVSLGVNVFVCVCLTPVHQSQQEKIDSIEDNVNTAAANVEEGTRSLGKVCVCASWRSDVSVCKVFGR